MQGNVIASSRHGSRRKPEGSHFILQDEIKSEPGMVLNTLPSLLLVLPKWYISSYRTTPPKSTRTVPTTGDKTFKCSKYVIPLIQTKMNSLMCRQSFFLCLGSCSQITTQILSINYKRSANGSGFLRANSYI